MATIKVMLRTSKTNSAGEAPLCIRITKNRQTKFVFLDYRIHPSFWVKGAVTKDLPNADYLNAYIAKKVAEAHDASLKMEMVNKEVASRQIKTAIKGQLPTEFFPYANDYANRFKQSNNIGTYRRVKTVIQKLSDYAKGNKLYFDQITVGFLKDYETHLITKSKNCINTINTNMRTIRTIFNNAVREDIISFNQNPFPKMKLKVEKTTRAFLTEEELSTIEEMQLPENELIFHHRNIYVFCAYAGGLRISDTLQLRWKNFDGEKINIRIQKTKTQLSIKLPDKALHIINSYKTAKCNSNDYIFPILNISADETDPELVYTAISSATAFTNKNLKLIATKAEINKTISFHTSRHTWATRAISKGMPIEYVSKLMGHAAIKETQIYARIINSELDKAMNIFN